MGKIQPRHAGGSERILPFPGNSGHQGTHVRHRAPPVEPGICGRQRGQHLRARGSEPAALLPHPVFQRLHDCGRHLHGGHGRAPESGHPPLHQRGENAHCHDEIRGRQCLHPCPSPALQCLPVCRAGSPLRHQSGSGYLPGAHPAGPLRNARLSGNGPGRGGSSQTIHRRFHGKPRSHYRST